MVTFLTVCGVVCGLCWAERWLGWQDDYSPADIGGVQNFPSPDDDDETLTGGINVAVSCE